VARHETTEKVFDKCLSCPLRDNKERLLGYLGIGAVNTECPGPDSIERFEAASLLGSEQPPEGYTQTITLGGAALGRKDRIFYRGPVDARASCPQEPISVEEGEHIVRVISGGDGRLQIRIGKGRRKDVFMTHFDIGPHPNKTSSPEEYLTEVAKRTIIHQ
jgi:hypothetical protein